MIKANEYFDGNVKSFGFEGADGTASVGVMAPGEYTFGTGAPETMRVVSGALTVKLPGSDVWKTFPSGTEFDVDGDTSFDVKVDVPTAYLCIYR